MNALRGGGQLGELVRRFDWTTTPLGPSEVWPVSLKATIGIVLNSRHPMFLFWGPELIQFYNDAYAPSLGEGKHPRALGQRGRECWAEIWPLIWPQIEDVMARGTASWNEDRLVPIVRNGRLEEVYWTYGYSPVFDDSGAIGGALVVCTETTSSVLLARRLHALGDLVESTAVATDSRAVDRIAVQALGRATFDVPFCFICLPDKETNTLRVSEAAGLNDEQATALATRIGHAELTSFEAREAPLTLPEPGVACTEWPEPVTQVFLQTLYQVSGAPRGTLVLGLSPRLSFDQAYHDFFTQAAERIGLALARADAFRTRAIADSERHNLLMQAPIPTAILTGPNHVFQLANEAFLRMLNRRALIEKPVTEAFPEVGAGPLLGILDDVYRTGTAFLAEEFPVPLTEADGTLGEAGFCRFSLEPLRDSAGTVYGILAMGIDRTEQVRDRRLLEKTNREREALLSDLQAANRSKDEFLALLGHELRNPLSPITTALELMRLRGGQASREEQIIERHVKHLTRLVDDLLDVSKITRGKVDLKLELLETANVVQRAVEIASFLFEQRSHRLLMDVPADGLKLKGDPVRLAQVIANLLTNAARYTNVGGTVWLRATQEEGEIVITVRDNGNGMSADMLPRIFEPFVQGKRTQERAEGSLGLGLALVKNLVSLHGGVVHAHSEGLGLGSEFSIRLPAVLDGRSSERFASAPPQAQFSGSKNVLVVDDNVDAADLLDIMLRTAGHRVTASHGPLEALEAIANLEPEVAILDIGLPVMDGYELGAKIRARAPGCRLIALTGYGQREDRARSVAAGFDAHLVKPVKIEALLAEIHGRNELA